MEESLIPTGKRIVILPNIDVNDNSFYGKDAFILLNIFHIQATVSAWVSDWYLLPFSDQLLTILFLLSSCKSSIVRFSRDLCFIFFIILIFDCFDYMVSMIFFLFNGVFTNFLGSRIFVMIGV